VARAERLLDLIQVLRRHRYPVSGQAIADELGVSLRTIYRDIQTLIGQGAAIDGEAGVGFVLRPGFVLPPLMFTDDEIEALVLGLRFVTQRTDAPLERAAKDALAKIAAVLPEDLRETIAGVGLLAVPRRAVRTAGAAGGERSRSPVECSTTTLPFEAGCPPSTAPWAASPAGISTVMIVATSAASAISHRPRREPSDAGGRRRTAVRADPVARSSGVRTLGRSVIVDSRLMKSVGLHARGRRRTAVRRTG